MSTSAESVYDFTAKTISGEEASLRKYQGKVVLIVNTASKCGFTGQYEGLEELYREHKDEGFEVLGFPSNQFANQEPGTDDEIAQFCEVRFGTSFPLFSKINVNGKEAHPLYQFLKTQAPGVLGSKSIKWNFTKFLVDRNGDVVERFSPKTKPASLRSAIRRLLKETSVTPHTTR